MGGRDRLWLWDQILKLEMDQRKHSKQLWECGMKILHAIQRGGGGQDDEESWGFEGGNSSDRGGIRHSLDWQNGMLRENTSGESDEEEEQYGDDTDGDYQRSPPLFAVTRVGGE